MWCDTISAVLAVFAGCSILAVSTISAVCAFVALITLIALITLKVGFGYQVDPCLAVVCAILDVPAFNTHCD